MRKLRAASVVIFCVLAFAGGASGQGNGETEPTAKEAIRQLLLHGNTPLTTLKNCSSMKTADSDLTLIDLLSGVLAFQAEPEMKNSIEFTFKREAMGRDQIVWVCDVTFRSGDDDSPSANGFRFKLRNSDRKLVPGSMSCIGTT